MQPQKWKDIFRSRDKIFGCDIIIFRFAYAFRVSCTGACNALKIQRPAVTYEGDNTTVDNVFDGALLICGFIILPLVIFL
jgi:hypothetical protein